MPITRTIAKETLVPVRGAGIHSATTKIFNAVRRGHNEAPRRRQLEHAFAERTETTAVARAWETYVARLTMRADGTGDLVLRTDGWRSPSTREWINSALSGTFGVAASTAGIGSWWNCRVHGGWDHGRLYIRLPGDGGSVQQVILSKGESVTHDSITVTFLD